MATFPYHGIYIGCLCVYHSGIDGPNAGTSDHELTVSRDGLNWHRVCQGEKFIPRGKPGSWDGGFGVVPGTGPIRRGDELWYYFSYNDGTHHSLGKAAIGLAKLRLDGFVSLRAGTKQAHLLSTAFVLKEGAVEINAIVQGSLQVRVLDGNTQAELAASEPFTGDSCHHVLNWRGIESLDKFKGKRVQLAFTMTEADLYAFQIRSEQSKR
jgi:hypothetical protein